MTDSDRQIVRSHTVAMAAGLAGWFVCALFASVAYNWTFYYLLALIVAGRELTRDRVAAARVMQDAHAKTASVPAAGFFRRTAPGPHERPESHGITLALERDDRRCLRSR